MARSWHGIVNPPRSASCAKWRYDDRTVALDQGAEMGRSWLGSTVVLACSRPRPLAFDPFVVARKTIRDAPEAMALRR